MEHKRKLTVAMTPEEHKNVKVTSAKLGISMGKFMLSAALHKMDELDFLDRRQRYQAIDNMLDYIEENEYLY